MNPTFFRRKWLAVFLALGLLTSCGKGCGKGGPGGGAKTDALDLIPAGNNFLVSLNFKKLRNAPFFSDAIKDAPAEAKELSQNVDEALVGLTVRGPGQPPGGIMVVSGNLDEKKVVALLEDAAKKQGGEVKKETIDGHTVYLSPKDPNIGLTFLSPNQAVWGQIANLKESMALAAKKGESVRSNKELMELFNKRDANKMLWGAGIVPSTGAPVNAQPGDPMASLQGIKAFSLGIDYDKELSIDLTANSQDAAQAQNLVNLINSYKTIFGASLAAQEPMWGQVIQGAQIGNQDKSVTISLKLSEALVKQLSQKVQEKKNEKAPDGMPGMPDSGMPPPPPAPPSPTSAPSAPPAPPPAN
ncbi:MAG: hypothetical protein U1F57_00685 [bacterium]